MGEAELVLAAIQAALKLYTGMRKAYVDATRDRPLLLPLPRAEGLTLDVVVDWFVNDELGKKITAAQSRIQRLVKPGRTKADESELFQLYAVYYAEANPPPGDADNGFALTGDELSALLQVRQWARTENPGHVPILQEVAGTLINIAVDYYANVPGAVSDHRPEGKALLAFLKAIDNEDFANTTVSEIAGDLMVGMLTTVSATPALLVGGQKEQLLVSHVSAALAESAKRNLATLDDVERRSAGDWLQIIAASMAHGATDTVLQNPHLFFGVKEGAESNVLKAVVGGIGDLVIGKDAISLTPLLSAQGVSTVTQALLAAVAANPDVIGSGNAGLKKLVSEVAGTLAASPLPAAKDLGPEVVKLVLERTAANLDLIWKGDRTDPGRNILVLATQQTLQALATMAADGHWTLSRDQILSLVDDVFAEVVQNPGWAAGRVAGGEPVVKAALEAALTALQGHHLSDIGADTVQAVLRAAITAVALRVDLLDKLPAGTADQERVLISAVIDAVLSAIFDGPATEARRWQLVRAATVQLLIETALAALATKGGANQATLDALRMALGDLAAGRVTIDGFAAELQAKLPG